MRRTNRWLAGLMTLALLLCTLPTAALAEDWEKTTDAKNYQDLAAMLKDEKVEEIKITGAVTVPENTSLDANKPILVGKEGSLKLSPGAVIRSDVPQGKFWYEDSAKTWELVGANMAAFLLFSEEDGSSYRVMYGTQPNLDEALAENAGHGALSTAVFSGADVTLNTDFDGATIQVLNSKSLTIAKGVSVKVSALAVSGSLTMAEDAKLELESGRVGGNADFRGGKTQKPEKLEVAGEVRFAEVQPGTEPEKSEEAKPEETKPEETAPETPAVNPFTDVEETSPFYSAILWAVEKEITAGTTATTFSPATTCTRAHILTFLWRAAGSPEPASAENPFTDVPENAYYLKAALWAAEKGIVETGETFGPFTPCTRASTVVYLWKHAGSPEVTSEKTFSDVAADAGYAAAVAWAVENGVTAGTSETTFSPENICTRGQIVTFLNRYLAKAE